MGSVRLAAIVDVSWPLDGCDVKARRNKSKLKAEYEREAKVQS